MPTTADLERSIDLLALLLQGTLPGAGAQQRMAVIPRSVRPTGPEAQPLRWSAVLLLLYPHEGRLWLPLIRRSTIHRHHAGQVGLPGGGREPDDASLWETALREAAEEIGIVPGAVRRLGLLTELDVPVSANMVQPCVGYLPSRPTFRLDADEVEALVELPLAVLRDPAATTVEEWELPGRRARVPFYRNGDVVIWGATAMILSELGALLEAIEDV